MPVSAEIRLTPLSAMRKRQSCFRRSELELRGPGKWPRNRSSVLHLAQIPNLPAKTRIDGGPRSRRR
eukprot:3367677-Alexandrium_andersonii.AAC.1